jgi:hypothetical protein
VVVGAEGLNDTAAALVGLTSSTAQLPPITSVFGFSTALGAC